MFDLAYVGGCGLGRFKRQILTMEITAGDHPGALLGRREEALLILQILQKGGAGKKDASDELTCGTSFPGRVGGVYPDLLGFAVSPIMATGVDLGGHLHPRRLPKRDDRRLAAFSLRRKTSLSPADGRREARCRMPAGVVVEVRARGLLGAGIAGRRRLDSGRPNEYEKNVEKVSKLEYHPGAG